MRRNSHRTVQGHSARAHALRHGNTPGPNIHVQRKESFGARRMREILLLPAALLVGWLQCCVAGHLARDFVGMTVQ
jgi:hypothetical protein